jgi:hypothetical protein
MCCVWWWIVVNRLKQATKQNMTEISMAQIYPSNGDHFIIILFFSIGKTAQKLRMWTEMFYGCWIIFFCLDVLSLHIISRQQRHCHQDRHQLQHLDQSVALVMCLKFWFLSWTRKMLTSKHLYHQEEYSVRSSANWWVLPKDTHTNINCYSREKNKKANPHL